MRRKALFLLQCILLTAIIVACSDRTEPAESAQAAADSTGNAVVVTDARTNAAAEGVVTGPKMTSVTEAIAENGEVHVVEEGYGWDNAAATQISLNGDTIGVEGNGATVEENKVTITAAGIYSLSGSLADGQIIVDTGDKEAVTLILDGVEISNSTNAPINIASAEVVALILADGSSNYISDGSSYVYASADEDEPNAAIFSKANLTIAGNGALVVEANYNDGITSKDGLVITGGQISVQAVDDGIRGKDYLVVKDGTLAINAGGDGLKADNAEDATFGYISIEGGVFDIYAGGDAIDGQTDVLIGDGSFILRSGGGSNARIDKTLSAKAIKATANVVIEGGTFAIDAADDAIHSNTNVAINGGNFTIATGDDGMHADENLTISGGTIDITKSYEGIESAVITVNGGDLHIVASDDGINVAGDNDGMEMGWHGRPGQDVFSTASGQSLNINGGYIYIDAYGDGVDTNGAINMTAGTVIVNGPTEQMNGALDHSGFTISGGLLVAVGSSGMAQTADASSTQNALLLNLNGTLGAGTLLNIRSSDGTDILTFAPAKNIQSIAFSSPELASGTTYEVSYGGQSTGEVKDGLYQGGTYAGGTAYTTFTVSGVVTRVGNVGGFGGRGGGRRP